MYVLATYNIQIHAGYVYIPWEHLYTQSANSPPGEDTQHVRCSKATLAISRTANMHQNSISLLSMKGGQIVHNYAMKPPK